MSAFSTIQSKIIDAALGIGTERGMAAVAILKAEYATLGAARSRIANLALRVALLRMVEAAAIAAPPEPQPEPEPPPPPPPPKGLVRLMALDDAARMLQSKVEPLVAAAAPESTPPTRPKLNLDFSMFADGDDETPAEPESTDAAEAEEEIKMTAEPVPDPAPPPPKKPRRKSPRKVKAASNPATPDRSLDQTSTEE